MGVTEINNDETIHPDIAQIAPFFDKLDTPDVNSVLDDILRFAESGNNYAAYLYASLKLFGRKPRYYKFSKAYPSGEVLENAVLPIDEDTGLLQLASMLKLEPGYVGYFQIEALYDLYKIIDGRDVFFKNNDLKVRPKSEKDRFYPLFSAKDRIRDLLIKLDYSEIYIDAAEHYLDLYAETFNKSDIDKAIRFLKQIIDDEYQTRFTVTDLAKANFLLGRLLLHGAIHVQRSVAKGISYLEASRTDGALLELIKFYRESDKDYESEIRHCLGLIQDEAVKNIAYKECQVVRPKAVNIHETLDRLINIKPNKKASLNMSFDFGEPETLAEPVVEKITEPVKALSESDIERSQKELLETFDLLTDDDIDSSETTTDSEFDFSSEDVEDFAPDEYADKDDFDPGELD